MPIRRTGGSYTRPVPASTAAALLGVECTIRRAKSRRIHGEQEKDPGRVRTRSGCPVGVHDRCHNLAVDGERHIDGYPDQCRRVPVAHRMAQFDAGSHGSWEQRIRSPNARSYIAHLDAAARNQHPGRSAAIDRDLGTLRSSSEATLSLP
jgi:hypothetical protein